VGDTINTRRNESALLTSRGSPVRNRQQWTVTAVATDGSLTVRDTERGRVRLPPEYVARHVELGWAVTGYGNQGVTVDVGICVVEPTTSRAGLYVGMTRGRQRNLAVVLDEQGAHNPAESMASILQRPAGGEAAHAVRDRLHGRVLDAAPEVERIRRRLDEMQHRTRTGPRRPSEVSIG
jgi:hypothetical protein